MGNKNGGVFQPRRTANAKVLKQGKNTATSKTK
jgi:hypothetical protein